MYPGMIHELGELCEIQMVYSRAITHFFLNHHHHDLMSLRTARLPVCSGKHLGLEMDSTALPFSIVFPSSSPYIPLLVGTSAPRHIQMMYTSFRV